MLERQIRHRLQLQSCASCGKQPAVYQVRGAPLLAVPRTTPTGAPISFFAECARCQQRTAKLHTLADVERAWNSHNVTGFSAPAQQPRGAPVRRATQPSIVRFGARR